MDIRLITTNSVAGTPKTRTASQFAGMTGASKAFLDAGLIEHLAQTNVVVDRVDPITAKGDEYADPIATLAVINRNLGDLVAAAYPDNRKPVFLGGNCSHTIGVLSGVQAAFGPDARIGLLWLDAHGDFNTPRTSYSQMLGGMPVAVAAGLAWPAWREGAGMASPLPTNRIVMVDVRNLDDREEQLVRATDVTVARFGEDWDPAPVLAAIDRLVAEIDVLYIHIDADILDATLQPNHPTVEPNGPDVAATLGVVQHALASGKVQAFAMVSINVDGEEGKISLASGMELLTGSLAAWAAV
ncbi:MAG TPA: arginase family protein [Thermomicrobiales bacterium]|nr:arginase family protein [Thermomicrobiales bacterium]